jgi:chemotaxis signal transduction protein
MQDNIELAQFIVFKISEYYLALPIDNILRIVEYSPQHGEKLSVMGLTQIGRTTIKILDLYQSLGCDRPSQRAERSTFLVVTHDAQGQPYGIPVYSPPDLVEMPLGLMQALPLQAHSNTILKIASHAAVMDQEATTKTVFLLDLKRVKDLFQAENLSPVKKKEYRI